MRRPREVDPNLPESLETLIAKALVSDPAHRPDDLGALASALYGLAPAKTIRPPAADLTRLDADADFEVDIMLSMMPPGDGLAAVPRIPAAGVPIDIRPFGHAEPESRTPATSGSHLIEQLSSLKIRLLSLIHIYFDNVF